LEIYFIVACLIVFLIFLNANEGLSAQNDSAVQNGGIDSKDTDNSASYNVLTISTNKPAYLPGETILVTGSIFKSIPDKLTPADLTLLLRLEDRVTDPYKLDSSSSPSKTFNYAYVMTSNGSFSFSGFSAPKNITHYAISATTMTGSSSAVSIEVVNPLFTIQYLMLILAFVSFGGLIVVILYSRSMDFAKSEILRFVLISAIVIAPIIGLLFSDSELGINSPISLIIKPETKGQTNTEAIWKNQWFIAVGGMKIDNYMSGILIPIYVVIFGLAGGYLRYLYNTSNKIWHLDTTFNADDSDIKYPLFKWNKIRDDEGERERFKTFLRNSLGADWITEGTIKMEDDDNKIVSTSKDLASSITIKKNKLANNTTVSNSATVNIGDHFYATLLLVQEQGDLVAYLTKKRKIWSFYQSLTDLALLLLSPLLAIAAWFILTRGGDIDKYIVALVSFTVGLATYSIISTLTDFATQKIKTQTTTA